MERRSFIKNTFGAIIGYALLPKCLTPVKEVKVIPADPTKCTGIFPGTGENTFKIKLDKRWFNKGDILQTTQGQAILLEKTETGFKGEFLETAEGPRPVYNQYKFIEIEHEENPPVAFIADVYRNTVDVYNDLEPKITNQYTWHMLEPEPFLKVQKICSVFIEEAEIV